MTEPKIVCTALKPFWWDGKNINTGDPVRMTRIDLNWMLARNAVVEGEPEKPKPAKKPAKG